MNQIEQIKQQFENPGTAYRSIPFWAWNDNLQKEELVRQLKEMKKQGMGGAFLHSREGLETVYMGSEWMDCVKETVKASEELGLHVWLYDEDRWPSGFAGGLVQARGGDAFRAKGLTMEVRNYSGTEGLEGSVALFKAVIRDRGLLRAQRVQLDDPCKLKEEEVLLVFREEISVRSEWFNNEAPPDNLNPDTVKAFIDLTYEAYKKEVGSSFGSTIKGVFTDEPSIHDRHCKFTEGRGWLPWSWSFPQFFKERRGYDFFDTVPYLYFDGELSSQARHDYWRTVTERFSESYSKQLGEWCEANGIAFTGHYLWENNMGTATRTSGAIMPNYRYQQVPGIDMLQEQTDEYITVKQCTSVANQYGRKFVVTETYGCTGWGFTFEGQKWIGDFQYVLGVNLRSQHLALYSIKGCRKRDYPPVINYNTSWWKYNHVTEDYFARLSAVLTEGQAVRDVLVLHPASTSWSRMGTAPYGFIARGKDPDVSAMNQFGDAFNAFLGELLRAHYDFDLGDEIILSEVGSVQDRTLRINLASYQTVVLPEIDTMLHSTFELLLQFMNAGGSIIAAGKQATMIEGRASNRLKELYEHEGMRVVLNAADVIKELERTTPRRVSLANEQGEEARQLLYMLKEGEDSKSLFVVNNDRSSSCSVQVRLEGEGSVEEWDLLTGMMTPVAAQYSGGAMHYYADFGPADSKLYVLKKEQNLLAELPLIPFVRSIPEQIIELGPEAAFTRTMPNVLTLDMCAYRFAGKGEPWSETMQVWQAQRAVREMLGMRQVYGNGIEQRYKWINAEHSGNGTRAAWKLQFDIADIPSNGISLVLELAKDYEIQLNGTVISNVPHGWFLDKAFDVIPLPGGLLRQGVNELILHCDYHNRMEMEDCYLIGDFGVSSNRKLVKEPDVLRFGDWCSQGYYHYAGSIVYHLETELASGAEHSEWVLELGDYAAVTMEVKVNGKPAGHVPWRAANRIQVSALLQAGVNRIDVEVMSSPRNMLGPFHQKNGEGPTTSWGSFRKEGDDYTAQYNVKPYGLFGGIKLMKYAKL